MLNNIKENSINKLVNNKVNESRFINAYLLIILVIILPILIIFGLVVLVKNKNHSKILRKESRISKSK